MSRFNNRLLVFLSCQGSSHVPQPISLNIHPVLSDSTKRILIGLPNIYRLDWIGPCPLSNSVLSEYPHEYVCCSKQCSLLKQLDTYRCSCFLQVFLQAFGYRPLK